MYFRNKSDREGSHFWPEKPITSDCQIWHDYRENYTWKGLVSEKLLVGKIVFRIPWVGYFALILNDSVTLLVTILIVVFIVALILFIRAFRRKTQQRRSEIIGKQEPTTLNS